MRYGGQTVAALRFASSTRRDLLLEILACAINWAYSPVRIDGFAHLTVCCG
jgi:hypothetical protein